MAIASEILQKLSRYCAYQERCEQEVRLKLQKLECSPAQIEEGLDRMIDEGFVDEARYAGSFVRGRFRMKGWGRIKIRQALRLKGLDEELVSRSLGEEITHAAYSEKLRQLVLKKTGSAGLPEEWEEMQKLKAFLMRKGYEYEVIEEVLTDLRAE